MAIRSLNNFEYCDLNGTVTRNSAIPTFVSGLAIFIDDAGIASTKKSRTICFKCGNVFEGDKCTCGNSNFASVGLRGRYWRRSDDQAHDKVCYIKDNTIKSRTLKLDWNPSKNAFVITEEEYDILTINNDRICANRVYVNETFGQVFEEYVKSSDWDGMRILLNKYPLDHFNARNNSDYDCSSYMIILQNIYNCIPNVENLSENLFYAILDKFPSTSGKFASLAEFYKKCEAPMALADLYSVLGVPSTTSLLNIDKLHPSIIMAIQYALIHHHITYHDLSFISSANIDVLNDNCYVFADYFRRNALKFGAKVYDAYLYVTEEGTTNIKDANMLKFTNYLRTKKFKENKINDFAKNIENGDAVAALKSLL